ncbi:unnamed protein product [Pocillopora meandrina]|uniref:Uncharacterized protein n=1 Tax=Pocillopora meandrina TaxID=46732 RepID=A0AAU9XBA5_9CNID|nr:unnamed protein product [Pocillopora meandrina]
MILSSKDGTHMLRRSVQSWARNQALRERRKDKYGANAPHDTSEEYYRRNLFIPFLDHITQEMSSRFGSTQKTAVQLLGLMLSAIVADTNVDIAEVLEMYMSDLRSPQTLDIEYDRWMRKWQSETDKLDALQTALQACDPDIFPNIHLLLRIACTIPVKSANNEHSNSTLKLPVDYDVQKFAEQQPRRKLLVDPVFEES